MGRQGKGLNVEELVLAPGAVAPWEQLEAETPKAYAAFTVYRDLPPGLRTQEEAARLLGKSVSVVNRWSHQHYWVPRSKLHDQHTDRAARHALEQQRIGMLQRHASVGERALEVVERWLTAKLGPRSKVVSDGQVAQLLRVAVMVERQSRGLPGEVTGIEGTLTHGMDDDMVDAVEPVLTWLDKLAKAAGTLAQDDPMQEGGDDNG